MVLYVLVNIDWKKFISTLKMLNMLCAVKLPENRNLKEKI